MNEKRKPYPFDQIEPKWQTIWAERKTFRTPNPGDADFDPAKPKFYVLDMFPYPSGSGLHVGHPEGYTATDIIARYRRQRGFNVLHPMGWDAFGLPAEQYAIKTGQHPRATTEANVANFKQQLNRIGFNYDWEREVNTTDPGYFKWTQWIFRLLYESWFDAEQGRARPVSELQEEMKTWRGYDLYSQELRQNMIDDRRLAYISEAAVNWCPALGTVLANEEVVDGKSEVGGFPVERRPMRQWMLRITSYAERLSRELDGLDWPESIKLLQRNWIGRSEGAKIRFVAPVTDADGTLIDCQIAVYTTRPDTLFGATYLVLSPEHSLISLLTSEAQRESVKAYQVAAASKSERDRGVAKEKTGVFTGAYAINPVNEQKLPVWIADYVLASYGLGAIMAVPGHDDRDYEFAQIYGIHPIIKVVEPLDTETLEWMSFGQGQLTHAPLSGEQWVSRDLVQRGGGAIQFIWDERKTFTYSGEAARLVNSSSDKISLVGLNPPEAKRKITDWLTQNGCGEGQINYKLRDWLFSRQRYWGEPFPIIWKDGKHESLPESELPLLPPELDDFKPTGTGEPPLAKATDWVRYSEAATRETNTMPQWAGSCWYYLRFCDPRNAESFVGQEAERYWMNSGKPGGVDLYVGGTEHAVLHLLYARFWHKVLFDYGYVSTPEPFQRLVNQGLILGEDGQKMSKSRGNVVNPDEVIGEFGADALRLYEMFMGPLEQVKPWSMAGVQGVARFLARVWRLVMEEDQEGRWTLSDAVQDIEPTAAQQRAVHAAIKKVTADIESLSFNTAISAMMVCTNELTAATVKPVSALRALVQILNPFAPHLTEELSETLEAKFPTGSGLLAGCAWPEYDEALLVQDEIEIPVQINGKLRDRIHLKKDAPSADYESAALANAKVQEHLKGKTPRKVIVVPGKLVNIVV